MSGSMRIQGPFTFATPATNILSAHQQASLCIPLRINRAGSSAGIVTEQFSTTIFINDLGNNTLTLNIQASNYPTTPVVNALFTYTIGQVMILTMSWDSGTGPNTRGTAFQGWKVDAVTVGTPKAFAVGCGLAGNRTFSMGAIGAGANYDMNIGPVMIWHDYMFSAADEVALRNGAAPSTIGPGPSVLWTFAGTVGAAPVAGQAGLNSSGSLTGASYNLSNLTPGTNGSASYSAETLAYAPAGQVDVYTNQGEGGFSNMIFALTRTALNTYPVGNAVVTNVPIISAVTAVNDNPTFTINGHPLTVYGGPISIPAGNPGTGYVSPVIILTGDGKGATATAIVSGATVTGGKVGSQGVSYSTISGSVSDASGPGAGATLGAIKLGPYWNSGFLQTGQDFGEAFACWDVHCGSVVGVFGYSGGSGYISPAATAPGVTFGTPVTADGVITGISVNSSGGNFINGPPIVTIVDHSGQGTGAKYSATIGVVPNVGNFLTGFEKISGGSNYSNVSGDVVVQLSYGTATIGAITIQDNVIVDIPIVNGGSSLGAPPVISIVDNGGSGSGADFICKMSGIAPTDVVRMTAPDRWIAVANGPVGPATNVLVTNYAGRPETVVSASYKGPDGVVRPWYAPAGGTPTMPLGVNMVGNTTNYFGVCTPEADWIHRVDGTVGSGTIAGQTFTQDGYPASLGSFGTVSQLLVLNSVLNGVDGRGQPLMTGTYNLVSVEGSPGTPTDIILTLPLGIQGYTLSAPTVTTAGNVTTKAYDIQYSADPPNSFVMDLYLKYTNLITQSNTLTKVALYCPGAAVNLADPLAPAPYMMNWMHAAAPKYPAILRIGDAAVVNDNCIASTDLNLATDYSWSFRHNPATQVGGQIPTWSRTVTVTSVRPFMSTGGDNPLLVGGAKIYLQEIYGFDDTPNHGPGTPGNRSTYASDQPTLAPYMLSPPDPSFLFQAHGGNFVGEAVCTAPHNFRTGDIVNVDNLHNYIVTATSGVPNVTKTVDMVNIKPMKIWVTGPTTFAFCVFGSVNPKPPAQVAGLVTPTNTSGLPGNVNNVYQAVTFPNPMTLSFANPTGITFVPVEFYARLVNDIPGCGYHFNSSAAMTDECIVTLATRLRDSLNPGRILNFEMSDEPWNTTGSGDPAWLQGMAIMIGAIVAPSPTLGGDAFKMYAKRAVEQFGLVKAVWDAADVNGITGRSTDLRLGLNSHLLTVSITSEYLSYCKSISASPDYIMVAPYIDALGSWQWLCAATAATHRGSIAYGLRTPWTLGMYLEIFRHHLVLSIAHNAPPTSPIPCYYMQHLAAIVAANMPKPPKLITYEAGLQAIVPGGGVSIVSQAPNSFSDSFLGGKITHDAMWHPNIYRCHEAFHRSMQNGGLALSIRQSFDGQRGTTTFQGSALWPFTACPANGIGMGDGSNGGKLNRFALAVNSQGKGGDGLAQDYYNDAPAMKAFFDWIGGVVAPTVNATATPNSGVAPLTVVFAANASEQGGTIVGYRWDFGDGHGTSTQQNPTYTYTSPGAYLAVVTVTDALGATATATAGVTVTAPVASNVFFADPTKVTIVW